VAGLIPRNDSRSFSHSIDLAFCTNVPAKSAGLFELSSGVSAVIDGSFLAHRSMPGWRYSTTWRPAPHHPQGGDVPSATASGEVHPF